VHGIPETIGT